MKTTSTLHMYLMESSSWLIGTIANKVSASERVNIDPEVVTFTW